MNDPAKNHVLPGASGAPTGPNGIDDPLYLRARRNMVYVLLLSLVVALYSSGWRMAVGVALGGALSFFNLRWLAASVRGILNYVVAAQDGKIPPFTSAKFLLRYYLIAGVIGAAVWSGQVPALGIGIGFFAFVGGVMIEAAYRLYLILVGRDFSEENAKE